MDLNDRTVQLTPPTSSDGWPINQLIAQCPPLDTNSAYCNILQCDHLQQTSVIAKSGEKAVGFISGYRIPERPDTLFIWQVAVDKHQRGTGLATRMLKHLLNREALADILYIETTITEDNAGSWALFTKLAQSSNAALVQNEHYKRQSHFNGEHDTEMLVRIGPFLTQKTGE